MKNVYVDLGSNVGDTILSFMASSMYDGNWIMHAFEPNPNLNVSKYPDCVDLHRTAVWIEDGRIRFFDSGDINYRGGTVIPDKKTGKVNYDHPIWVSCVDFSQWLRNNYSIEDNIIVKCDIEGAEYTVFEHLVADGTIRFITRLYLERHWKKFRNQERYKHRDNQLVAGIQAAGVPLVSLSQYETDWA